MRCNQASTPAAMSNGFEIRWQPLDLACPSLEIEEYTDGASYTVVGSFLVLFHVQVQPPVRPNPLSPCSR